MTAPSSPVVSRYGISAQAPPGWSVSIYRRPAAPGEVSAPALHAATRPLPPGRGDFASAVAARLGPDDALVVLLEYGAASVGTALFDHPGPPRLRADLFSPRQLQRTLPGQSGFQRFFSWRTRPFCLYVVLGSHSRRAALVPRVQRLLAGVRVSAGAAW